jgi:4-hydroxyphenylacetate 3-monooxygenase
LQGCTRSAVKLDFIVGLLYKAARATGRGVSRRAGSDRQHRLAEPVLVVLRCRVPIPAMGQRGVPPHVRASSTYRLFMIAYPAVRPTSKGDCPGLIYLPSHARDFKNPIDKYSHVTSAAPTASTTRANKIAKMSGCSRHRVRHGTNSTMNYSGSHELVRIFPLQHAGSGRAQRWMRSRSGGGSRRGRLETSAHRDGSDISV